MEALHSLRTLQNHDVRQPPTYELCPLSNSRIQSYPERDTSRIQNAGGGEGGAIESSPARTDEPMVSDHASNGVSPAAYNIRGCKQRSIGRSKSVEL